MSSRAQLSLLLPVAGLLLLVFVLVRTAWLCDDAYITFRVVDNFVHGRGLLWNMGERVLPSTHPLWLLLLTPLVALSGKVFTTSLLLSLLLSAGAAVAAAAAAGRRPGAQLVLLLALTGSRAFTDYATSGLETPLTYLLLALFLWRWSKAEIDAVEYRRLALLAGLAVLNRMDILLLLLPALIVGFRAVGRRTGLRALLLGFAPFLAWELFSLWYYGFPFPNSAYAKLGAGVPLGALLNRGLAYLAGSFGSDPLTPTLILAGILWACLRRNRQTWPVALGVLLYLLYTVRIGGDFMMGRYLAAPFLATTVLLARWPRLDVPRVAAGAAVLVLGLGLMAPYPALTGGPNFGRGRTQVIDAHGVADERAFYFTYTSLLGACQRPAPIDHPWANNGRRARLHGGLLLQKRTIGFFGYFAGPAIHIIDLFGLADPLLARLPARREADWRIGHLERSLPAGYEASIGTNSDRLGDPHLARYYAAIRAATRGRLGDPHRLWIILKLNLGCYDGDRAAYLATHPPSASSGDPRESNEGSSTKPAARTLPIH
jgi:arabinofuranosyltransferase